MAPRFLIGRVTANGRHFFFPYPVDEGFSEGNGCVLGTEGVFLAWLYDTADSEDELFAKLDSLRAALEVLSS